MQIIFELAKYAIIDGDIADAIRRVMGVSENSVQRLSERLGEITEQTDRIADEVEGNSGIPYQEASRDDSRI